MAVYKDKWNGYGAETWRVTCYFTDWTGEKKRHDKRGFATRKEAQNYEREFLAKKSRDIRMPFNAFVDQYLENMKPRIKLSTLVKKEAILDKHIRPYFKDKCLSDISSTDILQWQNVLLSIRDDEGKGYAQTYLREVQNQLTAIFNHAVHYYGLPKNPCSAYGKMGKQKAGEMLFWTKEEYLRFIEEMKEKPMSYYAFQILYWTGIRCGELLALTPADFDLEKKKMSITKTFQVINRQEIVTSPKTEKSNRVIDLPGFLCEEIEDYIASLYKVEDHMRLFPVTKYYLNHEMERGCKASGVKKIRVHDIRHSACALLINLGYSPVQIAERMGHESATVTARYSHLYPSVQQQMANGLDAAFHEGKEEKKGSEEDE